MRRGKYLLKNYWCNKKKAIYYDNLADAWLELEMLVIDYYYNYEFKTNKKRVFELLNLESKNLQEMIIDIKILKQKEYKILPEIIAAVAQAQILYNQNSDLVKELYIYKPLLEFVLKDMRVVDELDPKDEKKYLKFIQEMHRVGYSSALSGIKFYYYKIEELKSKIKRKYQPLPEFPKEELA